MLDLTVHLIIGCSNIVLFFQIFHLGDEAIVQLFEDGFSYQEIVDLLRELHDIVLR